MKRYFAICCLSILLAAAASATPMNFDLAWSGAPFENGATAVGSLTLDDAVLPNPGPGGAIDPAAALGITAFSITVSGSSGGNGTFGLADFSGFVWDTGGVALDLSVELVGQPTLGTPWGDPSGAGGDFNIFASTPGAPTGVLFFQISTAGGESLLLTSFAPSDVVIPEPSAALLFGIGAGTVGWRLRGRC